jgi:hypothetical protein
VWEIRTLHSTWRGLETGHGRDAVTLADERARQQGEQPIRLKVWQGASPCTVNYLGSDG